MSYFRLFALRNGKPWWTMASCDPVFIRRSPLVWIVSHPLTQIGLIWKAMKNGFWSGKYLPTRLGKSIVSLHNDRDDNDDVNNVFIIETINFINKFSKLGSLWTTKSLSSSKCETGNCKYSVDPSIYSALLPLKIMLCLVLICTYSKLHLDLSEKQFTYYT